MRDAKAFAVLSTVMVGGVIAGGLLLSGCANNEQSLSLVEKTITLRDGRTILCVYGTRNANDGGISCDWEPRTR